MYFSDAGQGLLLQWNSKEQDRLVLDPAGKELLVSAVKSWGILRVSLDVNCCLAYGGNRRNNTEVGLFQISEL